MLSLVLKDHIFDLKCVAGLSCDSHWTVLLFVVPPCTSWWEQPSHQSHRATDFLKIWYVYIVILLTMNTVV